MATSKFISYNSTDFVIIDDYFIDVAVSEEHTFEAEITSMPVESGSTISDNYYVKPNKVTIEGIVSNAPFGPIATERGDEFAPADEAYRKLLAIRNAREPVTITTSLDTYKNMALTSLSIPRGPGGADYLHFTAQFEELQIVSVDKTKPAIPTASPPTNKTVPPKSTGSIFRMLNIANNPAHGSFIWFDNNISAWRHGGAMTVGGWIFLRGVPYGYPDAAFRANMPSDSQLKKYIAGSGNSANGQTNVANSSPSVFSPQGSGSGNPFNPFDPHNAVSNGAVYTARDIKTVNGNIVTSDIYTELTGLGFFSDL